MWWYWFLVVMSFFRVAGGGTWCSYVVVVVLTLTRIIKSVVTGQAPVTLELRSTPGKTHTQPMVVHAYITADAIHASTRNV